MNRIATSLLAATLIAGCATAPPKNADNACTIFDEKDGWYAAARAAEKRWGTPIQVQLAIIRQESGFRGDAKPPHDTFLGVPMLWRQSDAYGYAQAVDSTWDWYVEKTGNRSADRDDFGDAVDFVAWYANVTQRSLGISKWDAYNQYLAFHEGQGGFQRKTFSNKPWLIEIARRVDRNAKEYAAQLHSCRARLEKGTGWW